MFVRIKANVYDNTASVSSLRGSLGVYDRRLISNLWRLISDLHHDGRHQPRELLAVSTAGSWHHLRPRHCGAGDDDSDDDDDGDDDDNDNVEQRRKYRKKKGGRKEGPGDEAGDRGD